LRHSKQTDRKQLFLKGTFFSNLTGSEVRQVKPRADGRTYSRRFLMPKFDSKVSARMTTALLLLSLLSFNPRVARAAIIKVPADGNYRLAPSSPFKGQGSDVGRSIDALADAEAARVLLNDSIEQGSNSPYPLEEARSF
jgi:hypothetical protein